LVGCSRSLNARSVLLYPRGSRFLIASRYQSSHIEERYFLYNRASIPARGKPGGQERRDRVEPNAGRKSKIGDLANLNSLARWLFLLISVERIPCYLTKNSLFRCVGNSASKPLSFLTDWTSKSAAEASFSQIPCSFPC